MLGLLKLYKAEVIGTFLILLVFYYVFNKGYDSGALDKEVEYGKIVAAETVRYEELKLKYSTLLDESEDKITKLMEDIDAAYVKGLDATSASSEEVLAAWGTSVGRLSIELANTAQRADSCDSKTTTPVSGSNATTRAELSDAAAKFLIGEAQRADRIVLQLTACQNTATTYRNAIMDYEEKVKKNK